MEVVKGKALEVGTRRGFEVILFISSDSWSDLLKSLIRIEERELARLMEGETGGVSKSLISIPVSSTNFRVGYGMRRKWKSVGDEWVMWV